MEQNSEVDSKYGNAEDIIKNSDGVSNEVTVEPAPVEGDLIVHGGTSRDRIAIFGGPSPRISTADLMLALTNTSLGFSGSGRTWGESSSRSTSSYNRPGATAKVKAKRRKAVKKKHKR